MAIYPPANFGRPRHCGCGNMFLICQVISRDYVFKELCDFMG